MELYEEIKIWERTDVGEAVCYRCLHIIPAGGYSVQSADFYRAGEEDAMDFNRQFIELLIANAPSEIYPTLELAITEFKKEFIGWEYDALREGELS